MGEAVAVPAAPLATGPGYPLPDVAALTATVVDALRTAADPKAARTVVVRELQATKAQASTAFEAAFRAAPRHA
ncbi:hypothetical protein, partial [Tabrizicola sp.]|uniref:hypothetical protein n=1 Tax=Tabrizicola sp. TaxID=2005166 RepID=UPI003F35EC22